MAGTFPVPRPIWTTPELGGRSPVFFRSVALREVSPGGWSTPGFSRCVYPHGMGLLRRTAIQRSKQHQPDPIFSPAGNVLLTGVFLLPAVRPEFVYSCYLC